jgi:hypothetical protein
MTRNVAPPELVEGLPPTSTRAQGSTVRPRYGRITAFGSAALVCAVAFLGGVGVLPDGGTPAQAQSRAQSRAQGSLELSGALTTAGSRITPGSSGSAGSGRSSSTTSAPSHGRPDQGVAGDSEPVPQGSVPLPDVPASASTAAKDPSAHPLPAESGSGKRVVFDLEQQRVWLVSAKDRVRRTYLASGSVTDNLKAGTYEVYSHSEDAVGIDGTTMHWMVRFTRGDNAAIGFHDLPMEDGHPVQRLSDLGTPQSHGCIRQAPADARALWRFAPVGTTVVVTG